MASFYVGLCWIIAAFSGLMFGYDIGISGGVIVMDDFLIKFFPKVYQRNLHTREDDNYCKFNDPLLQQFTSSVYLTALVASFGASKFCTKFGRKPTIMFASVFFIVSAALSALAQLKGMLIIGRILFGIGVGFGNEAIPLFLSEIAPVKRRGAVNMIIFQLLVAIGIVIANLVNYGASKIHPHGWRVSLGLAGVPGLVLFIGSMILPETPTSLVERGIYKEPLLENEFKQHDDPFKKLLERSSRPPLAIAIFLQAYSQFTGINGIMFYAPVLFQTVGIKSDVSLLFAIITGIVNVMCTLIAIFAVDKFGRRKLLLEACAQMFICQMVIGGLLLGPLKTTGTLDKGVANFVVVVLVCVYVGGFAWSWGPMGWLIPSETFPLETRTAGIAFAVSTKMLFTFLIAQSFLSMLCYMKAYVFFFFSAWILYLGICIYFFLPETKGVPIDSIVDKVWKQHPLWKKSYMLDEEDHHPKTAGNIV